MKKKFTLHEGDTVTYKVPMDSGAELTISLLIENIRYHALTTTKTVDVTLKDAIISKPTTYTVNLVPDEG